MAKRSMSVAIRRRMTGSAPSDNDGDGLYDWDEPNVYGTTSTINISRR